MLSLQDVENIAFLARLEIQESEKAKYQAELSNIFHFIEKINELDLSKIEPTSHILNLQNVVRKDEILPSYSPDLILKNAPKRKENFMVVPKTV
ncbi:MAG TPA: Asp-tRNA(Asn)/Glu-tRNA(Gln) amidotransferase subunit GatB [Spirochaetia bacterium]|nr:MAG: asparaginyl/glutamyl-tRNA amidotransferase subunit C [Spirochaetes bacterium GWB1_36_13]HCL56597.1 Asp-tRNA(Asn)/Glu-tRNA(Gln) amidotransferase subunit GatB [Spirochaetia bacterium]